MSVYVDPACHPFGNMVMCHMWADNLDDLLAMADRIGVDRKWIQGHPTLSFGKHRNASWVHFDIAKSKRALAIKHGAIETDKYGPLEHLARIDLISGNPLLAEKAQRKLDDIAALRGRHKIQTELFA